MQNFFSISSMCSYVQKTLGLTLHFFLFELSYLRFQSDVWDKNIKKNIRNLNYQAIYLRELK